MTDTDSFAVEQERKLAECGRHRFVYERDSLRIGGAVVERCTQCGRSRVRQVTPGRLEADTWTDLSEYLKRFESSRLPNGWQVIRTGGFGFVPDSQHGVTHAITAIVRDAGGKLGTLWLCRRVLLGSVNYWPTEYTWDTISAARCQRCDSLLRLRSVMGVHPGTSYVYYAQRGAYIKIGYSVNVGVRMGALKAKLLAVEPGGAELERWRHDDFRDQAVGGEWFEAREPLIRHVVALRRAFDEQAPIEPANRTWGLQTAEAPA